MLQPPLVSHSSVVLSHGVCTSWDYTPPEQPPHPSHLSLSGLQTCSLTQLTHDCACAPTQAVSQTSTPAPSASKARLEELVMRQTKQLIPVVASASARDKAKGKGTAASGPKHNALAATGGVSGMGQGIGRSKAGLDTAKRGEDAPSGTHITTLWPL